MIICPLVLSTIYAWNIEATYYMSSILTVVGVIVMGYLCTWKNAKSLGRPSQPTEIPEPKVEVEMKPVEVSNEQSSDLATTEEKVDTTSSVATVTVEVPNNNPEKVN